MGVLLWHQNEAVVIDTTQDTELSVNSENQDDSSVADNQENMASGENNMDNQLVFSPHVFVLCEDDASEINSAIQSIYCNTMGQMEISFNSGVSDRFISIGNGSIFYLEGDKSTPFGSPYIGKIVSVNVKKDGSSVVVTETPGMDEVFDSVSININDELTEETISSISAIEGVTITYTDTVEDDYNAISNRMDIPDSDMVLCRNNSKQFATLAYIDNDCNTVKTNLKAKSGAKEPTDEVEVSPSVKSKGLVLEFEVDLFNMMEKTKNKLSTADRTLAPEDEDLSEKRNTADEDLSEKVVKDLIESFNEDQTLKLTGKAALSNISFKGECDWSLWDFFSKPAGFTTLNGGIKCDILTESTLTLRANNLTFHGTKNELQLADLGQFAWGEEDNLVENMAFWGNQMKAKISGLNDKLIPIACIQWTPISVVTLAQMDPNQMNNLIHINSGMSPLSAALILYLDASGNISTSLTAQISYNTNFYGTFVFARDGKYVGEGACSTNHDTSWELKFATTADADICFLGLAVDVYLFNISVVDINAFKIGVEGAGTGGVQITSDNPDVPNVYKDYYARLYCKLMDMHMNLKVSLVKKVKWSMDFEKDWIVKDLTWWQTGTKRDTRFDENSMSYGQVTAEDKEYIYYLSEGGNIYKQNKETGKHTILCDGGMTKFCGIDASYLYLLKKGSNAYDIFRVDKSTGISRDVQKEVAAVLTQDSRYIYYLPEADETKIRAFDRDKLESKEYHDFDDNVQIMSAYGNYYYVSTKHENAFSVFFGAKCNYYLMNANGKIVADLGESPDVKSLPRVAMPGYYYAAEYTGRGILRSVAAKMYWISADLDNTSETVGISGWLQKEVGVFVTLESEGNQGKKYTIWLYKSENGRKVKVTDVYSNQAFFTLCQDAAGYWHFFDETEDALILYQMDSDFSNVREIEHYDKRIVTVSLADCSMEIIGNKMILYSITGGDTSATATVIFRYDLY